MSAAEFLQLEVSENVAVDLFNFSLSLYLSPTPPHSSSLPQELRAPLSAQALQLNAICINVCFILASNAAASSEEEAFFLCVRAPQG